MTDVYEFSEYDRKDLIYSFSNMTAEEIAAARDRLEKYNAEQAAKKAAAAAVKATPASPGPDAPLQIKPEPPVLPDSGKV